VTNQGCRNFKHDTRIDMPDDYPRILEFIDEFPKTPKGNIKKLELIERMKFSSLKSL